MTTSTSRAIARRTEPRIVTLPDRRMAVVHTTGDPNVVGEAEMKALYGALYGLKFALKKQGVAFAVEPLRARWPDAHLLPKDQWHGIWALPVPEGTVETDLVQKVPGVTVTLEDWPYGTVAEILHLGSYADEPPTIARLHAFIADEGYLIAGPHEEEYLTRPDAKHPKTIIRYQVVPRG